MGFRKRTPEELAGFAAAVHDRLAAEGRERLAFTTARETEREQEWTAMGPGAGPVPFLQRLMVVDNHSETAWGCAAHYIGRIGLRPEDTYSVDIERKDSDGGIITAVSLLYRDSPDYRAARRAYFEEFPERTPTAPTAGGIPPH